MLRKGMSEKLNLSWSYDATEAKHITGFKQRFARGLRLAEGSGENFAFGGNL